VYSVLCTRYSPPRVSPRRKIRNSQHFLCTLALAAQLSWGREVRHANTSAVSRAGAPADLSRGWGAGRLRSPRSGAEEGDCRGQVSDAPAPDQGARGREGARCLQGPRLPGPQRVCRPEGPAAGTLGLCRAVLVCLARPERHAETTAQL